MMVSLFTFENVHRAYLACRRGKRNSRSALEFEMKREENLFALCDALQNRTYQSSPAFCFVTNRPKYREIFAADFRDRIVHHLIVAALNPLWEPVFIHDSFACRKGKGTHAAVYRLQSFFRKASANGSRDAWFLHADVRSYFLKINKAILLERLQRRLLKRRPDLAEELGWLLERVVNRDTAGDAVRRGQLRLFDRVPPHKSLFYTGNKTGLPIGNYTSQFFANVYLDALDQYAKHTLKIGWYYVRYVDDIVLVGEDRHRLEDDEKKLGAFLRDSLGLEWNPAARRLAPVSNGCDFLGYIVFRNRLRVRRRTVAHCREKLRASQLKLVKRVGEATCFHYDETVLPALRATLASYDGQFRHAGAGGIWNRILAAHPYLRFFFRRTRRGWRSLDVSPGHFSSLPRQYRWFARRFRRCLMLFRIGPFYEFYGRHRDRALTLLQLSKGRARRGLGNGAGFFWTAGLARRLDKLAAHFPVVVIEQEPGPAGNVRRRKLSRLYWKLPAKFRNLDGRARQPSKY